LFRKNNLYKIEIMQEIQSLSITVPTGGCVNNCKYCVSKMHSDSWIKERFKGKSKALKHIVENAKLIIRNNKVVIDKSKASLSMESFLIENGISKTMFEKASMLINSYEEIHDEIQDFYERLKFARDNGVNTVILTGVDGEILQNKPFLKLFNILNNLLPNPFSWIEAQTSGVMLEEPNPFISKYSEEDNLQFLKDIGVKTISLSISDIFDNDNNAEITQIPKALRFNLDALCKEIKQRDFNLRLSLNLSDCYNVRLPQDFFDRAEQLEADQITFRVLYTSPDGNSEEDKWIYDHSIDLKMMDSINDFILDYGNLIGVLSFGAKKYGVHGISTVIDQDCMNEDVKVTLKSIIVREDLSLYTKWDERASKLY